MNQSNKNLLSNNILNSAWYVIFILALCLFVSCQNKKESQVEPESETTPIAIKAEDWNSLFIRNSGWFGGDGIFGIPMDGKEFVPATDSTTTLFTFSDTMIGHHDGDTLFVENFRMINNSFGILKGKKPDTSQIKFYWKKNENGQPLPLFVPKTTHSKPEDYYWLGDGFVNVEADSTLYVFAYPIHEKDTTGTGGFNFEQIGVNLLSIPVGSQPPYDNHIQIETPFFERTTQTTFGSAIFVNTKTAGAPNPDGYIYVYAVSNREMVKGLLVARVIPKDFTAFDQWVFWNGATWVKDMGEAVFIAEHVSNEMSVSPLQDGRIVLTYQFYTMSPEVAIQIGQSPVGPFGERITVYHVPEVEEHKTYTTYNSKAYPHLAPKDSLLISYNINSMDFWNDILENPNLYRPRFFKYPIEPKK